MPGAKDTTGSLSSSLAGSLPSLGLASCAVASGCVEFGEEAEKTQAVILAMRGTTPDSRGMPYVRYHVAGKEYEATLSTASGDMRQGMVIDVLYARDNPENVRLAGSDGFFSGVLLFMGLVFGGMGTLFLVVKKRHENRIDKLVAAGYHVQAEVTNIELDDEQYANGRTLSSRAAATWTRAGVCTSFAAALSGTTAMR